MSKFSASYFLFFTIHALAIYFIRLGLICWINWSWCVIHLATINLFWA